MKIRNILLNLAVGTSALLFGLAWVGVYNFFLGNSQAEYQYSSKQSCLYSHTNVEDAKQINFDINDPNSVLPIDYEEDKLTDPKSDENNAEYFDAEGTYFALNNLPAEFSDFEAFVINNKTLDYDKTGNYTVEDIAPEGYVADDNGNKIEFENVEINNGQIKFETKSDKDVSFSFEGDFLVKGNFYTLDENAAVAKGTLTKNTGNKEIAVQDVTFGWMIDFE